jgi:hypothetical protein
MFPNNEIFIYDTVVAVNLGHFSLLLFDANFINVFFELIVNYERVRKKMFFCSKSIF